MLKTRFWRIVLHMAVTCRIRTDAAPVGQTPRPNSVASFRGSEHQVSLRTALTVGNPVRTNYILDWGLQCPEGVAAARVLGANCRVSPWTAKVGARVLRHASEFDFWTGQPIPQLEFGQNAIPSKCLPAYTPVSLH